MTNWIEIDEARLRGNFEVLRAAAADAAVLAVVKANAYGHGLETCARVLAGAGAEWLGVTGVEEGLRVRRALAQAGIASESQPRVLVMCGITEEDADLVVEEQLTPVVWAVEQVRWLREAAERADTGVLRVCVEVDSGMTRQGVRAGAELAKVVRTIGASEGLRMDGVMTHFADAEVAGSRQTSAQRDAFGAALRELDMEGVGPAWVSVGNTSGMDLVDREEGMVTWVARLAAQVGARAMVRTGLGLYGYSLEVEGAGSSRLAGTLQPVMTWKAKVIGLEEIPPGAAVGYNGTFVAKWPMRLALVSVGYADGLRREFSSTNAKTGGWVMVRGRRAPLVGRVSMNLTSVDVTEMDDVRVGDDTVVLGEGITAEDHARLAGTISYEILCGVRAGERGSLV